MQCLAIQCDDLAQGPGGQLRKQLIADPRPIIFCSSVRVTQLIGFRLYQSGERN